MQEHMTKSEEKGYFDDVKELFNQTERLIKATSQLRSTQPTTLAAAVGWVERSETQHPPVMHPVTPPVTAPPPARIGHYGCPRIVYAAPVGFCCAQPNLRISYYESATNPQWFSEVTERKPPPRSLCLNHGLRRLGGCHGFAGFGAPHVHKTIRVWPLHTKGCRGYNGTE